MANTLTNLIPDAFAAMDVVSRELVGFIPAVARDPKADQVALGQTLRIEQTPPNAAGGDVTPAMAFPAAADQIIGNKSLTITKSRFYPFSWNGEEQKGVNAGPGFLTIQQDQIAQAIRGLINEMENDLAVAAYKGASRAYGTAGTTPFASDLSDSANVRKILDDNGAPLGDRTLVINTTAAAKMRTLTNLTKANESGDTGLLRQGTLLDVHGFAFRESAKVAAVTKGTMTGALVNNGAGYPIGATTIVFDTGTPGATGFQAGDVVTFAGDTNKYIVAVTIVAASGNLVLNAPGLLQAVADNVAITVGNNSTDNVGFSRNAILLATRLPAVPVDGDLASDRFELFDERSGITLELARYPGYRMNVYQVALAWGVVVIKPEHVAILLG